MKGYRNIGWMLRNRSLSEAQYNIVDGAYLIAHAIFDIGTGDMRDIIVRVSGDTYPLRQQFNDAGFAWNPDERCYEKRFDKSNYREAAPYRWLQKLGNAEMVQDDATVLINLANAWGQEQSNVVKGVSTGGTWAKIYMEGCIAAQEYAKYSPNGEDIEA